VAASAWDGQWTDNSGLGIDQFICADEQSRSFSSIYSEAGVLVGNLTSNYRGAKGRWYEAGLGDCTSGTFEIYLASDGKSFSGLYICSDSTDGMSHGTALPAPTTTTIVIMTMVERERENGGHWWCCQCCQWWWWC
jgi:hypothetical protein